METYLDNSATTRICKTAREELLRALDCCWGNPSSLHYKGIEAEALVRESRRSIARELSCNENELYFTSGGTEANNLAIFGAAEYMKRSGRKIITTAIEHPSVLECFAALEKEGFETVYIGVDSFGNADMAQLEREVTEDTVLISMMAVNNEVGTLQKIEELSRIVKRKGSPALIHVDGVQAFGKIPLTPKKWGIDLMTVSSHKIHGPKGVGALFVRDGVKIKPRTFGGGQERLLRPGTEAVPAIAGFGGAVRELTVEKSLQQLRGLNLKLRESLKELEGVKINSPDDALPYIISLSLEGLPGETVLNLLSDMEIYVSTGSACAKGHKSHVLTAMGLDSGRIASSIRVSLSRFTCEQELDYFIEGIKRAFKVIMRK